MIQFLKHDSILSRTLFINDELAAKVHDTCIEYNGRLHHSVIMELIQERHGIECMILGAYLLGQLTVNDNTNDRINDMVNRVCQN